MPACPSCHADYPPADINVSEGVAYCRDCDVLTRLSDLLPPAELTESEARDFDVPAVDVSAPPRGCGVRDLGSRIVVTASARSLTGAVFPLFFALFWNGIVSIFVTIALAGTMQQLFGWTPSWLPAQGFSGMPVLFLWLFLTPFILVGTVAAFVALTSLLGRCEVVLAGPDAVVFTGFGPVGWKRRFSVMDVTRVRLGETTWKQNDRAQPCIEIVTGGKSYRLATIVPETRRNWMAAALKELLLPGSGHA